MHFCSKIDSIEGNHVRFLWIDAILLHKMYQKMIKKCDIFVHFLLHFLHIFYTFFAIGRVFWVRRTTLTCFTILYRFHFQILRHFFTKLWKKCKNVKNVKKIEKIAIFILQFFMFSCFQHVKNCNFAQNCHFLMNAAHYSVTIYVKLPFFVAFLFIFRHFCHFLHISILFKKCVKMCKKCQFFV